jgi:hypothetical protein
MEQGSLVLDAPPQLVRDFLEPEQVDAEEGGGLVLEIQREPEPFHAIHPGCLDGEVDVRALEIIAPRARAEQPDPLDFRMLSEARRQFQDQLAARKIRRQGRSHRRVQCFASSGDAASCQIWGRFVDLTPARSKCSTLSVSRAIFLS